MADSHVDLSASLSIISHSQRLFQHKQKIKEETCTFLVKKKVSFIFALDFAWSYV